MGLRQDRVVLVTGASRGIGKGIATWLGGQGATVYVTGRTEREGDAPLPGTVHATAAEIDRAGGRGIAVPCDHADDPQVAALFERIDRESGRLDVLVASATHIPDELIEPGPFWDKPIEMWRMIDVGLRSTFVAAHHAARRMAAQGSGLIVGISSFGARCYMHGPVYGAGKAGSDKMLADMAHELRPHGVAALSLWMGMALTERTQRAIEAKPEQYGPFAEIAETAQFGGVVIDAIASDPAYMERSGQTWIAAELAAEYGVKDTNGKQPPSHRSMLGEPAQVSAAAVQ